MEWAATVSSSVFKCFLLQEACEDCKIRLILLWNFGVFLLWSALYGDCISVPLTILMAPFLSIYYCLISSK